MTDCEGKFLYFAYASNLLSERIHINNPSAKKKAVAKLKDHRFEFNHFNEVWKGSSATIVESPGDVVWGVLWEIENQHLETLDKQEGVLTGFYRRKQITVETEEGEIDTYAYQMTIPLGDERKPSWVYKETILRGAREHGLPKDYIKNIEEFEDNGYKGEAQIKLSFANK